jgi:hypothetical protein
VEVRSQNWYLGWSFGGEGENPGVRRVVDVEILFQQLPKHEQKANETPSWLLVFRLLSSQANIKTHSTLLQEEVTTAKAVSQTKNPRW